MKTTVRTITPAEAAKILETCNNRNRPISKRQVKRFASDMKQGSWAVTHQGIAFDDTGALADGQHRLSAIVAADVPVKMMVTTGVPRQFENGVVMDVMDVVDRGQMRSVAQQLHLSHGIKDQNRVAAVVRVIAGVCTGDFHTSLTTAQTLKILDLYGDGIECVMSQPWPANMRRAPLNGTLAVAYYFNKAACFEFSRQLATMENVESGSAVQALYRWNARRSGWTADREKGKSCQVVASAFIRFTNDEPTERIIGSAEAIDAICRKQKAMVAQVCEIMA